MTRLFVEQLTVIDCAFLDAQRGLVGESWIVDVELSGDLDEQSMVLDFGEVKKTLKRAIDDNADHKLVVPGACRGLSLHRAAGKLQLEFDSAAGRIQHRSPASAVCLLQSPAVTGTALAAQLEPLLLAQMPRNVSGVALTLRHEDIRGASYHYTHGLKKHQGHCQRIAHGHRSRLQIRVEGERDEALEQGWAGRWRDIYLGTREDVVSRGQQRIRFEYHSSDGDFALELPENRCDLLDADSTVERIAEHLARRVAAERPGRAVEVRAYEGVMKGAIASA